MIESIYEKMIKMYAKKLDNLKYDSFNDFKKVERYINSIKVLSEKLNKELPN
jgi:hypothetical protein